MKIVKNDTVPTYSKHPDFSPTNLSKKIDRENMIKIANIGKKYKSQTAKSLIQEQMQSTVSTLDKDYKL